MIINMFLIFFILFIIKWEVDSDYSESHIDWCFCISTVHNIK